MMDADDAQPFLVALKTPDDDVMVQIDPEALPGPDHAGILLADFARHMAMALAQTGKADSPEAALNQMLDLFEAELNSPTDTPTGGIAN